jgi:hypothetical protein
MGRAALALARPDAAAAIAARVETLAGVGGGDPADPAAAGVARGGAAA